MKIYFQSISFNIVIIVMISFIVGIISDWKSQLIILFIRNFSIAIALIFLPYWLLNNKKIRESKLWSSITLFSPAILALILEGPNAALNFDNAIIEIQLGIKNSLTFFDIRSIMLFLVILTCGLQFRAFLMNRKVKEEFEKEDFF